MATAVHCYGYCWTSCKAATVPGDAVIQERLDRADGAVDLGMRHVTADSSRNSQAAAVQGSHGAVRACDGAGRLTRFQLAVGTPCPGTCLCWA